MGGLGTAGCWGLLDALPADVVRQLRAERSRHYPAGATLFLDGDAAVAVFVLLTGRVKVVAQTAAGRAVLLAVSGPGQLVGELAALDGGHRSASAVTLDPVSALVLGVERFRELLAQHPPAALGLLATTSGRLRDADRKRVEFASLDTAARVASRLLELADQYGEATAEGLLIDLGLTQDEIAGWTGSSREALTRALSTFRSRGWISTERRRVLLLDLPALRARAR